MSEQTAVTGTPGPLADPEARRALMADVSREPGSSKPDPILEVDHIIRNFGGMTAVARRPPRGPARHHHRADRAQRCRQDDLLQPDHRVRQAELGQDGRALVLRGRKLDKTSASSVALAGMVRTFQLTKSLNRMTVMDNMMLGARGQRGENLLTSMFKSTWGAQEKAIEAKALELLHRFKLHAKKDDYAGSLSGGQRKLLEMARALMSDPTMIMLDEPMAGVNPALTQSLLGHIQTLRDEGMTVLFVEHDMHVVRHISDWVVVMAEGRIVAEGPADTVMSNPAVIDAYLGAHHDTDLGDDALLSDEALEEMAAEVAAEKAEREGETA